MGAGIGLGGLQRVACRLAGLARRSGLGAWRGPAVAACAALLTLGLLELGARAVLAALRSPSSYEAARNPNFLRGWVEYTTPRPRAAGERLIVLISNSQGFAHEYEDAAVSFPSRMREALSRMRPAERWTVLNWSVPGGQGAEMAVLGARAAAHRPDLVIYVVHTVNFTGSVSMRGKTRPLTYGISDVGELAYFGSVRRRLSAEFLERFQVSDPTTWLMAHVGLVRLRSRIIEPREGAWTWKLGERPIEAQPAPWKAGAWTAEADALLRECVRAPRRGRAKPPVAVVSMPLRRPSYLPEDWAERARFSKRARAALARERGVTVIDAVGLVEPSLFCTHTHLRPEGHRVFGEWLALRVLDLLER